MTKRIPTQLRNWRNQSGLTVTARKKTNQFDQFLDLELAQLTDDLETNLGKGDINPSSLGRFHDLEQVIQIMWDGGFSSLKVLDNSCLERSAPRGVLFL